MGILLMYSYFVFVGVYSFHFSKAKEPVCSKFSYEEQLLEKMIRTEIKVEMMVNEIKTTQDNVLSTLGDIKKTVAEFSEKFGDLRGNITGEMLNIDDEMKRREELFQKRFEETKSNLTNFVEEQRKELSQLGRKLDRPPIAFHAHHVTDTKLDTTDEVIIFDKTFINEGTGYDTTTGIFRAPVGGFYQFVVHICAQYNSHVYIGLVLEGTVIATDANYDKDYFTCSTVGAIVLVRSGEKVWVKSTSSASNRQLFEDSLRMNTFSGFLVKS